MAYWRAVSDALAVCSDRGCDRIACRTRPMALGCAEYEQGNRQADGSLMGHEEGKADHEHVEKIAKAALGRPKPVGREGLVAAAVQGKRDEEKADEGGRCKGDGR